MIHEIVHSIIHAPGWQPGTGPSGTADPTSSPNPTDLVGTNVRTLIATAVTGSAGAMILVSAGVLALTKGWELMLNTIRAKRSPQQLTLF